MPGRKFSLKKPEWVKGIGRALRKKKIGLAHQSGASVNILQDSDSGSDTDSLLGTDWDASSQVECVVTDEGEVPSLFETCARLILENPKLVGKLNYTTPLRISDLWECVESRRRKQDEMVLTQQTVTLKGSRNANVELVRNLRVRLDACSWVTCLRLDDCANLTDGLICAICIDGKKPALPHLQQLSVSGCRGVSDLFLKLFISVYSVQLKKLDISKSSATQKCVKPLAKWCPEIQTLSLAHILQIRDKHLVRLANSCSNLRGLDLSYCKLITDAGITAIAEKLWCLEALNLSYCDQVGSSVGELRRCGFLHRLRLQNCPGVTDMALSPVLGCCTLMDVLCVRGCPLITMKTITKIKDVCANMRVLDIVGIRVEGNAALEELAKSHVVRSTLKEYMSSQRAILKITPHVWRLYNLA